MESDKNKYFVNSNIIISIKVSQRLTVILVACLFFITCQSKPETSKRIESESISVVDSLTHFTSKAERIDTVTLVNQLFRDIDILLATKDSLLIANEIFGDCIYEQLDIDEPHTIHRIDIMRNFNRIFDKKFKNEFTKIKNGSFLEYKYIFQDGSVLSSDSQECKYVGVINVIISVGTFSRVYWFSFDGKKWIFRGITGVG